MRTPRHYQYIAIARGTQQNLLLADQMGLGKSLVGIETAKALFPKLNAAALVVCPKGIRAQWQAMIEDQDPGAIVLIFDNNVESLHKHISDLDYIITHYEAVVKHIERLNRFTYSTLIIDEAHRIKNRKSLRTKAVKKLKAYRKLALTGTAWDKDPSEIWSILHFLAPHQFTSYWQFLDRHVQFDVNFLGFPENPRLKSPRDFANEIAPHVLQRKKREVMPELPPLIQTHIPIDLGAKQRVAYDRIKKIVDMEVDLLDFGRDPLQITNILTKLTRLLQVASNPQLLDIKAPSAKFDWLLEWLHDNATTPVLIYTRYRRNVEALGRLLPNAACVASGIKPAKPLAAYSTVVATIAALGEGYDLGHLDTAIYIDCEWSSILMQQSIERIDRGSNTESKNIIFLQATNTVDDLMRQALNRKLSTKQIVENYLQAVSVS